MAVVDFPKLYMHIFWIALTVAATIPTIETKLQKHLSECAPVSSVIIRAPRLCKDVIENCDAFARLSHWCTAYKSLASKYCEAYCGFCTGQSTRTAPQPCVNKENNCAALVGSDNDFCVMHQPWARERCEASCGFCIDLSTTSAPRACVDEIEDCDKVEGGKTVCLKYESWAREYCKVYCGFCVPPSTTTVATTPPKTKSPGACENELQDCHMYGAGKAVCVKHESWARKYCEAYCGFCVPPSTTTAATITGKSTSPRPCVNKVATHVCATFVHWKLCNYFKSWASDHCEAYCGFCVGPLGNGEYHKTGDVDAVMNAAKVENKADLLNLSLITIALANGAATIFLRTL